MWDNLLSWVQFLWKAGADVEKNTREIEELVSENRQLAEAMRRLAQQRNHDVQMFEQRIESLRRELLDAQEKSELRLRLDVSEKMRQLPPAKKTEK